MESLPAPAPGTKVASRGWLWPAVGVSLCACALRLLWPLGLDLYGDEAYYALWSQRPALGYFDHPPLVAWLLRAAESVGHSELWLRLPFAICGGLAVLFSAGIARELSRKDPAPESTADRRAPILAAFLTAVAPLAVLTSALALPDAPLAAAIAGCTWLVLRARRGDLLWAGALFGLALLSKYSAATLLPGFALIAFRDPAARSWLRGAQAWIGMAIAAILFAPCAVWNATHGFESLAFQIRHASGGGFSTETFLAFVGTEILGAGPLTLALALPVLWRGESVAARRLAALTLVPLAWFAYAAARGKFEANWPAFLDPSLCAAAAVALSTLAGRLRQALVVTSSAAAVAAVIVLGLELRHPRFVPAANVEVARFHAGRTLASAVRSRLNGTNPFLFTNDYQDAGELAFYGGFTRLGPCLERPSQLDVWNDHPTPGEPFVFLGPGLGPGPGLADAIASHFPRAHRLRTETFTLSLDGETVRSVSMTWFQNFRGFVR